jgi:hypothetical protein
MRSPTFPIMTHPRQPAAESRAFRRRFHRRMLRSAPHPSSADCRPACSASTSGSEPAEQPVMSFLKFAALVFTVVAALNILSALLPRPHEFVRSVVPSVHPVPSMMLDGWMSGARGR